MAGTEAPPPRTSSHESLDAHRAGGSCDASDDDGDDHDPGSALALMSDCVSNERVPKTGEEPLAGAKAGPSLEQLHPALHSALAAIADSATRLAVLAKARPDVAARTGAEARLHRLAEAMCQLAAEHVVVVDDGGGEGRAPPLTLPNDESACRAIKDDTDLVYAVAALPEDRVTSSVAPSSSRTILGSALEGRIAAIAVQEHSGGSDGNGGAAPGAGQTSHQLLVARGGGASSASAEGYNKTKTTGSKPAGDAAVAAAGSSELDIQRYPLSRRFMQSLVTEHRALLDARRRKALANPALLRAAAAANEQLAHTLEAQALVEFTLSNTAAGSSSSSARLSSPQPRAAAADDAPAASAAPPDEDTAERAKERLSEAIADVEASLRRCRRTAKDAVRCTSDQRSKASAELATLMPVYRHLTNARDALAMSEARRAAVIDAGRREKVTLISAVNASRVSAKTRQADVAKLNTALRGALLERRQLSADLSAARQQIAEQSNLRADAEAELSRLQRHQQRQADAAAVAAATRPSLPGSPSPPPKRAVRLPPPAAASSPPPGNAPETPRAASNSSDGVGARPATAPLRPTTAQRMRRPGSAAAAPSPVRAATRRMPSPAAEKELVHRLYAKGVEDQRKLEARLDAKRDEQFRNSRHASDLPRHDGGGDDDDDEDEAPPLALTAEQFAGRMYYEGLKNSAKSRQRLVDKIAAKDKETLAAGMGARLNRPRSATERASTVNRLYAEGVAHRKDTRTRIYEATVLAAEPKMRKVTPEEDAAIRARLYVVSPPPPKGKA